MIIKEIAEHKVCLELLPENAIILDLGARGYLFTDAMRSQGHRVIPVDIDKLEGVYHQVAISDYNGRAGIQYSNDPQGTQIKDGNDVPCYTLESFMEMIGVPFFDLIKIDIEGAERQLIRSLNNAPAKQLSIEFHLHTGAYTKSDVDLMVIKLQFLGYKVASHELTEAHGAGFNYWTSLFILE